MGLGAAHPAIVHPSHIFLMELDISTNVGMWVAKGNIDSIGCPPSFLDSFIHDCHSSGFWREVFKSAYFMDLLEAVVKACLSIIVFLAANSRAGNNASLHVMTVMAIVVGHELRLLWRESMDFEILSVAALNCSLTKDLNVNFESSVIKVSRGLFPPPLRGVSLVLAQ